MLPLVDPGDKGGIEAAETVAGEHEGGDPDITAHLLPCKLHDPVKVLRVVARDPRESAGRVYHEVHMGWGSDRDDVESGLVEDLLQLEHARHVEARPGSGDQENKGGLPVLVDQGAGEAVFVPEDLRDVPFREGAHHELTHRNLAWEPNLELAGKLHHRRLVRVHERIEIGRRDGSHRKSGSGKDHKECKDQETFHDEPPLAALRDEAGLSEVTRGARVQWDHRHPGRLLRSELLQDRVLAPEQLEIPHDLAYHGVHLFIR